jgi:ABC-type branched-subunit amino acid transport system substrate-binding protein
MPNAKDFVTRFTAKYGPIQMYAPYSYDAANTLIEAMKKANSTDPAKYLPELAKISYDGITGRIEFDEHGDPKNGPFTLYQVKNGNLEPVASLTSQKSTDSPAEKTSKPRRTKSERCVDLQDRAGLGEPVPPEDLQRECQK